MPDDHLTLVLGLDGATWDVLGPLLDAGDLPFIQSCIDAGVHGTNRTVLPHNTTPAWQAYARGVDPSKLGIYHFTPVEWDGRKLSTRFIDATDYAGTPIWRAVEASGRDAAVLNLHDTAPVDETANIMVSEHAVPDETHVRPDSIQPFVTPEPEIDPAMGDGEYFDALLGIIQSRFDLAERIITSGYRPDFLHLSIFYIDAIQHRFWGEPEVERAWKQIDESAAALIDATAGVYPRRTTVLVSDHGHTANKDRFYINNWLQREGYLVRRTTPDRFELLSALGLHRDRLERWSKQIGLYETARRLIPFRYRRAIPDSDGKRSGALGLASKLDAGRTLAFSPGADQLYFQPGLYPYGLVRRLRQLRHPVHGDRVFKRVVRGHRAYSDPDARTPDLLFEPNGYSVYYTMPASGAVWDHQLAEPRDPWRSVHTRDGIFAARGPAVRAGERVNCRLVDIAPTLLHAMDVPVPAGVDGQVLDIFTPGSGPAERAVVFEDYGASAGRDGDVSGKAERLRALGYLE